MEAHSESEAVEERHRGKHLVAHLEHRIRSQYLSTKSVEVEVRQLDAFSGSSCAAGVENGSYIVRASLHSVLIAAVLAEAHEVRPLEHWRVSRDLLDLAAFCQHVSHLDRSCELVLDAGDDHVLHFRFLTDRLDLVVELVERNYHHRIRHVEVVLDLLLSRERVDHVRNCAYEVDRIEYVNSLRAIRHRYGDLFIFPDAENTERLRAEVDLVDHMLIRDVLAHEIERDVERMLLGGLLNLLINSAVEVFQCLRKISVALEPRRLHVLRDRIYYLVVFVKCPVVTNFACHSIFPFIIKSCVCAGIHHAQRAHTRIL